MKNFLTFPINTLEQLSAFACRLAENLCTAHVFFLSGTLGAGKTTFAQFLIKAIFEKKQQSCPLITSPTFSLMNIYTCDSLEVAHFDLYRLKNPEEFLQLGAEDYMDDALCLIEWAENAIDYLPEDCFKICFFYENENRYLTIEAFGAYRLENLNLSAE